MRSIAGTNVCVRALLGCQGTGMSAHEAAFQVLQSCVNSLATNPDWAWRERRRISEGNACESGSDTAKKATVDGEGWRPLHSLVHMRSAKLLVLEAGI